MLLWSLLVTVVIFFTACHSSPLYTQLTELILHLRGQDSTTADGNQLISLSFRIFDWMYFLHFFLWLFLLPFLNSLDRSKTISTPCCCVHVPLAVINVIRSLIHSLQSSHCKLYKLHGTVQLFHTYTTDHTQLTTVTPHNTPSDSLFIDDMTPSLTALARGLKCNTTI